MLPQFLERGIHNKRESRKETIVRKRKYGKVKKEEKDGNEEEEL